MKQNKYPRIRREGYNILLISDWAIIYIKLFPFNPYLYNTSPQFWTFLLFSVACMYSLISFWIHFFFWEEKGEEKFARTFFLKKISLFFPLLFYLYFFLFFFPFLSWSSCIVLFCLAFFFLCSRFLSFVFNIFLIFFSCVDLFVFVFFFLFLFLFFLQKDNLFLHVIKISGTTKDKFVTKIGHLTLSNCA